MTKYRLSVCWRTLILPVTFNLYTVLLTVYLVCKFSGSSTFRCHQPVTLTLWPEMIQWRHCVVQACHIWSFIFLLLRFGSLKLAVTMATLFGEYRSSARSTKMLCQAAASVSTPHLSSPVDMDTKCAPGYMQMAMAWARGHTCRCFLLSCEASTTLSYNGRSNRE